MSIVDSLTGLARAVKGYLLKNSEVPKTAEYTTMLPMIFGSSNWQQRPAFGLTTADLMCLDEQVWFATCVSLGPLMNGKVKATGESKEVNGFAQRVWDKLWRDHAQQFHRARLYGRLGGEVVYEQRDGLIEAKEYLDRHPIDTHPLTRNGKVVGVAVQNVRDSQRGKVALLRGRGLWLVHDPLFNALWGQSMYRTAYGPWWEKACPGGALDLRRLRFVKDAWIGDIFRYPSNGQVTYSDGTTLHAREVVREAADNRASGGSICIPSDLWATGEKMYDYIPPQAMNGQTQIGEWVKDLDDGIFKGLLIPKEVVEAASTGSGFSGRSIPLVSFLAMHDLSFRSYVKQIKEQVIDLLVWLNFGLPAVKQYELEAVPLIETMGELMGPMGQPNTSASDGPAPPQPGQAPAAGGGAAPGPKLYTGSTQFSGAGEFKEEDHPRDEAGRFTSAGAAAKAGKSFAGWSNEAGDAFVRGEIGEDHPAWLAIQHGTAPSVKDYNEARDVFGKLVRTSKGDVGVVEDVADDASHVIVRHPDGSTSKQHAGQLDHLGAYVQHRLSGGKDVSGRVLDYLSAEIAREMLDKQENVGVVMRRHGLDPVRAGVVRSKVADLYLKESEARREAAKPKPSEARARAMEKQRAAAEAEEFRLANDPPKPVRPRFDSLERTAQKKLLDGMDALPGQLDLFSAAGRAPAPEGARWITIGGHEEGDKKHAGGFPVQISGDGTILRSGGPQGLVGKNVRKAYKHFQGLRAKKEAAVRNAPPVEARPAGETGKPQNEPAPAVAGGNKPPVEGESEAALAKLAKLPEAGEGYQHFKGAGEHVKLRDVGFVGMSERGYILPSGPQERAAATVMDVDPAKSKYVQSSVLRDGVARKIKGESVPGDEGHGKEEGAGLPTAIKDGDSFILVDGNHRAVADVLKRGKFKANVFEIVGYKPPKKGKKNPQPIWAKPGDKNAAQAEPAASAPPAPPVEAGEAAEPEDGDASFDFGGGPAAEAAPVDPRSDNPDMPAPKPVKKRMAPKDVIQFKKEGRENVAAAAREYGLDERELATVVHELWTEKRAALVEREKAKGEAKRALSVSTLGAKFNGAFNAKKAAAWEDAGHDYSEWPGIDESAVLIANEYPELGLRVGPGVDTARQVWDLVKEPYQEIVDKSNKRLIDAAAEYLAFSKKNGDLDSMVVEGEDDGEPYQFSAAVDFARAGVAAELRLRLGELLGDDVWQFAAYRPAPGQRGLFDEEEHPRADDGKFAEKAGGGGAKAAPASVKVKAPVESGAAKPPGKKVSLAEAWKNIKPARKGKTTSVAPPDYRLHDLASVRAAAKGMDFNEFMDQYNGEQVNLDEGPGAAPKIYHDVIPLADLDPSEYGDWEEMQDDDRGEGGFVAGLTKKLQAGEKLQPVLVEGVKDHPKRRPQVLDGHHRTVSAKLAGKQSIAVTYDSATIAGIWAKANGVKEKPGDLVRKYEDYRKANFADEEAEAPPVEAKKPAAEKPKPAAVAPGGYSAKPKPAAEMHGKIPTHKDGRPAKVKAKVGYHVTTPEAAAAILKGGFDPAKFKAQWRNDHGVSLSMGGIKPAASYFMKNEKGATFDPSKKVVLKVEMSGRFGELEDVGASVENSRDAKDYSAKAVKAGWDGMDGGGVAYVYNTKSIGRITAVSAEELEAAGVPVKK